MSLNDFWGNLFIARHLDLQHLESFYNGFYPVGYSLLLRLFAFAPIESAYLLNIAFGLMLLGAISWLAWRTLGPRWSLGVVILASLQPLVFRYVATPSADIGCAAFVAVGVSASVAYGLSPPDKRQSVYLILGAAAFGLSGLLRYHGLVAGIVFLACLTLIWIGSWRACATGLVVIFGVYSVQFAASVVAGHGPFDTSSELQVYRLVHGLDWYHVAAAHIPSSIISIITDDPSRFVRRYAVNARIQLVYALPSIAWVLVARQKAEGRLARAVALASVLYILVVSLGVSERGTVPVVAIQVWCAGATAAALYRLLFVDRDARDRLRLIVVGLALAVLVIRWANVDRSWVQATRVQSQEFAQVERLVSPGIDDANQVFSTDFELYLPHIPGHYPRVNGGWPRYDTYAYDAMPDLETTNLESFYQNLVANRIRYLVLSPSARSLMPSLGRLYDGFVPGRRFTRVGREGDFVVLAVH